MADAAGVPRPFGPDRELPKILSVDDHIVEPPHLWETWLPAQWKDRAPRIVRKKIEKMTYIAGTRYDIVEGESGADCDCWEFEGATYPHKRHVAAVGFDRDDMTLSPITYDEMRSGCWQPAARVQDMLDNWVDGSVSFPTFPRFCGQTFTEIDDKGLGLACVKAYNDYMVEEWCGDSGGVLIPLIIIPLWDVELASAEVQRNADRGVHAVCFSEMPPALGLPSIHSGYWDPFFDVCQATATTICMHIGSSSQMPVASPDAPPAAAATLSFNNAMASLSDYLFSGVLVRYPDLKLAYSEGQIGWIPYILERADDVWREHRAWGGVKEKVPEPPSTYYYRQVFGCFFRDQHGLKSLEEVGVDNITFETDYPHTDSTWPDTRQIAEEYMAPFDDETVYKIMRGNAIRMLSLDRT